MSVSSSDAAHTQRRVDSLEHVVRVLHRRMGVINRELGRERDEQKRREHQLKQQRTEMTEKDSNNGEYFQDQMSKIGQQ